MANRRRGGLSTVARAPKPELLVPGAGLTGRPRNVNAPSTFAHITLGAVAAWVAVGGDLLGSCVYGPDTLGRAVASPSLLLLAGGATILSLALFALAYQRLARKFPHGGGGYTAAKKIAGERLALVSGIALVIDAAMDVAVSVVFCLKALSALAPSSLRWLELPLALTMIVLLTLANLRGVRESVRVLAPIVGLFVLTHVLALGWALVDRGAELPARLAVVSRDVVAVGAEVGMLKLVGLLALAFASGGSVYTGVEAVSNAAPLLREPRRRTARRTMVLVAGVPALLLGLILSGYVLYDVRAPSQEALNAVLFERIAASAGDSLFLHLVLVILPLVAEALLLLVAAQTGFSDGPRTLAALAADRFLHRSLVRLNGRLAPQSGILVVGGGAFGATALVAGDLEPLLAVFVTSVFVTITISQLVMLKDALRPSVGRRWPAVLLHAVTLLLSALILVGTAVNMTVGAVVTLIAIVVLGAMVWAMRKRQEEITAALDRAAEALPDTAGVRLETGQAPGRGPWVVLLVGETSAIVRCVLSDLAAWPERPAGITLASVSLVDAETVHGAAQLRAAERTRRERLRTLARYARQLGFQTDTHLRRAADLVSGAAAMALDLALRREGAVIVGGRAGLPRRWMDRLVEDDVAGRVARRLGRAGAPMIVMDIPA